MIVINSKENLKNELIQFKPNSTIGFVPTMGALHNGHLSLIQAAKEKCDIVIASIFVNPRQFDNQEDLEKYPNLLDQDLDLLEKNGCDITYTPTNEDVYSDYNGLNIDLSPLDEVMEGKSRNGHFKGVTDIVYFLFDLIKPTHAFFGLKDFQQVSIIRFMTAKLKLPVEIIACKTIREDNGLAMSSRNLRLTPKGKDSAKVIFKTLKLSKEWMHYFSPTEVIQKSIKMIEQERLKVEYVSIVDPKNLNEISSWQLKNHMCIVAHCENIRLIDNLELS